MGGMTAESVTPRLVAALDRTWTTIRARHPDVPEVVITLGAGSAGGGPLTLGHFADGRWQRGPGDPLPELFVAGEGLARGPAKVLATLLHEGAHGAAATRKIQDTSRQGRWHNARYRAIAAELGLDVAQAPGIGWSDTTLPTATAARYAAELDDLAAALVAWRHPEHRAGRAGSNNGTAARCPCGRRIRVAESVLAVGPITCGLCHGEFAA
jgi:hypothetical protein